MASTVEQKRQAAQAALDFVEDGMKLGIGTGSTANEFVRLLAERVEQGLNIVGVPTSEQTARLCVELGVPLQSLDECPQLDLTIDGADEIDSHMNLIKGGGGALLREKIVAVASSKMIVIADDTKVVDQLGAFPLPIEVNAFGMMSTFKACEKAALELGLSGDLVFRQAKQENFVTDGGHFIIDASFGRIPDPEALQSRLWKIPGVVESGLFIGICSMALIASDMGIKTLKTEH